MESRSCLIRFQWRHLAIVARRDGHQSCPLLRHDELVDVASREGRLRPITAERMQQRWIGVASRQVSNAASAAHSIDKPIKPLHCMRADVPRTRRSQTTQIASPADRPRCHNGGVVRFAPAAASPRSSDIRSLAPRGSVSIIWGERTDWNAQQHRTRLHLPLSSALRSLAALAHTHSEPHSFNSTRARGSIDARDASG